MCFVHKDGDEASERVLRAVNASGKAFLTHTRLADHYVIRVAVGAAQTERGHVESLWTLLQQLS